jgi:hypothetical protein
MWNLLAILVLIAFFLLWRYHARESEETEQAMNPQSPSTGASVTTANAVELPPPAGTNRRITYELTRWDAFQNYVTIVFRNRLIQIMILVGILAIEGMILRGYYGAPVNFLLSACLSRAVVLPQPGSVE